MPDENVPETAETAAPATAAKRTYVRKIGVDYDTATGEITAYSYETDGKTKAPGAVGFNLKNLPSSIVTQLAMHGASQKVSDATRTKETVQERVEAIGALVENLKAGKWDAALPDFQAARILEATCAAMEEAGRTPDRAALAETLKSKNEQAKALANAKISAMYLRLYPSQSVDNQFDW